MNVCKVDINDEMEAGNILSSFKNKRVDIDSNLFNFFIQNDYDFCIDKSRFSFFIKNGNTKLSHFCGSKGNEYSFDSSNDDSSIHLEYYSFSNDESNMYLNMKLMEKNGRIYIIHTADYEKKFLGGNNQDIEFYCGNENEDNPLRYVMIHNPSKSDKEQLFYDIIYSYLNEGLSKFEEIANKLSGNSRILKKSSDFF